MSENNINKSDVVGRKTDGNGNNFKKYKRNKDYKKKQKRVNAYVPPYADELMVISVEKLGLSDQTVSVLVAGGVDTLGKICLRMAKEMYFIQRFGKKQLNEVSQVLKKFKVDFRPSDDEQVSVATEKQAKEQKKSLPSVQSTKNADNDKRKDKNQKTKQTKENVGDNAKSKNAIEQKNAKNDRDLSSNGKLFQKPPFVPSPRKEPETDRFVKFQKGGKWGFKDKSGREVIPPIYDEVFNFKEDVACVERKELFGYINRENEMIIPYKYDVASSFSEGLACVGNDSKCGYVNKNGDVVVPFIFDAGTPFKNGVAQVKQNDRWGTYRLESKDVDWNN